jgi:hypothetical protein
MNESATFLLDHFARRSLAMEKGINRLKFDATSIHDDLDSNVQQELLENLGELIQINSDLNKSINEKEIFLHLERIDDVEVKLVELRMKYYFATLKSRKRLEFGIFKKIRSNLINALKRFPLVFFLLRKFRGNYILFKSRRLNSSFLKLNKKNSKL